MTRRACGVSPRCCVPLDEALIEVALDLSGRPYLAYDVAVRRRHRRARVPALRPPAGRGVLAGLRHGGRAHPAHARCGRAATPTTSSRPVFKGVARAPARRRAGRGRGCPVDQGRPVTGRPEPSGAVHRRHGLRDRQPALGREGPRHLGAPARLVDDPGEVAGRPGGAARRGGLRPVRRGPRGTAGSSRRPGRRWPTAGRSSASASAFSSSTRPPRRAPGARASGSSRARCGALPGRVKRPQMQWNRLDSTAPGPACAAAGRSGRRPVGVLRPLLRPASRPRDRGHVRLRRPGGGRGRARTTSGAPSSTRRSPVRAGLAILANFVARCAAGPVAAAGRASATPDRPPGDGPAPGHRPARRPARCAWSRAISTGETVYGDPVALAQRSSSGRGPLAPRGRPGRGPDRPSRSTGPS